MCTTNKQRLTISRWQKLKVLAEWTEAQQQQQPGVIFVNGSEYVWLQDKFSAIVIQHKRFPLKPTWYTVDAGMAFVSEQFVWTLHVSKTNGNQHSSLPSKPAASVTKRSSLCQVNNYRAQESGTKGKKKQQSQRTNSLLAVAIQPLGINSKNYLRAKSPPATRKKYRGNTSMFRVKKQRILFTFPHINSLRGEKTVQIRTNKNPWKAFLHLLSEKVTTVTTTGPKTGKQPSWSRQLIRPSDQVCWICDGPGF